ncbi:MAG: EscU/YscU/HrcU family type III secretion system export apparatus switch protein [Oscillospiraceae bacterium]|nr:EscU/YscU/HrcU family type III secretion system export apparatus switch protein [Oscillospiraceae bacterium]
MSRSKNGRSASRSAVALQYGAGDAAPVVVASGMGYMAEKIVETAADAGIPIYEDNSLATALAQLKLGQEIPEELYKAIVEIYVYFLNFDPDEREKKEQAREAERAAQETAAQAAVPADITQDKEAQA